jgi:biopolymer transport protein ExbD
MSRRRPIDVFRTLASQRSDINVTPLIDVCLVLLLIFMIVTPALTSGDTSSVALPQTDHPRALPRPEDLLTLVLEVDGTLTVAGERLPAGAYGERLSLLLRGRSAREVVLRADGQLRYAQVRDVLRVASEANLPGMSLATIRKGERAR